VSGRFEGAAALSMEASALTSGRGAVPARIAGRSPLLRLQSDEKLVALTRSGSHHAYEGLVRRYHPRLLAFCRHMLASREDAEDVLQEVFAAAFNALHADDRPIAVKPWLYRIARNRCLNHLRRVQPIGVDTMDVHLADGGATTADAVGRREDFRLLMDDVHKLAETQRTALLLREMEALSYDQIAEAMDTTVPAVKSLLVRARMSLAEAAEARKLSCEQVRFQLGQEAEGLLRKLEAPVRRHLRECDRCDVFRRHLRETNKALAAALPIAPAAILLKKLAVVKLGHSAAGGAAAGGGALAGSSAAGGLISAGMSAMAGKAAAGLAAAALVTAGAVEVRQATGPPAPAPQPAPQQQASVTGTGGAAPPPATAPPAGHEHQSVPFARRHRPEKPAPSRRERTRTDDPAGAKAAAASDPSAAKPDAGTNGAAAEPDAPAATPATPTATTPPAGSGTTTVADTDPATSTGGTSTYADTTTLSPPGGTTTTTTTTPTTTVPPATTTPATTLPGPVPAPVPTPVPARAPTPAPTPPPAPAPPPTGPELPR
jgi:RNA polymerase sigma factor (sigma-70 family)